MPYSITETICFIEEYKYLHGVESVTYEVKKSIIRQVKEQYPELRWKKGGILYGKPIRRRKRI